MKESDNLVFKVGDIETYKYFFLYMDINPYTKEERIFQINKNKNDLYAFVKYLKEEKMDYFVGFNSLRFDAPVIQFILENFRKWHEKTNLQICEIIWRFASDLIDDLNYGLKPAYPEWKLWTKQCDLYCIHHFDNEARRTSLKWIEYSVDFPTIEAMPVAPDMELSDDDIEKVIFYCGNDRGATHVLFNITRGDTNHPEYIGKDKIQDRLDIMEEFGYPSSCMNWSDVKIGDEFNKRGYCKLTGIRYEEIYDLKKKRKPTKKFTFGDCIPNYVTFETPLFKEFHKFVSKEVVRLFKAKKAKKQEYHIELNGTRYTIAKGGIHSQEKKRIIIPNEDEILRDADVGSQYPNAINKRKIYPAHLGPKWNVNYNDTTVRRLDYKNKAKDPTLDAETRRKAKGATDWLKLALNGGGFGKLNDPSNWQYDPFALHQCTIGNEFEILMLIERLEMRGIHVVSANTDGIVCLFKKHLEPVYKEVCDWWEKTVGNDVQGKLEFADYVKLVQTSVNDYIAVKSDGEVKKKGDFMTVFELHKNKSRKIIPIALEKYFIEEIPVEETILAYDNIYDFCIGVKASKDYHYESITRKGETSCYEKVVRYYVSNNGNLLLKIKNENSDADGVERSNCEAGGWLCSVANTINQQEISKFNINYDYYIEKAKEIIKDLEMPRKKKGKKIYDNPNQISLF